MAAQPERRLHKIADTTSHTEAHEPDLQARIGTDQNSSCSSIRNSSLRRSQAPYAFLRLDWHEVLLNEVLLNYDIARPSPVFVSLDARPQCNCAQWANIGPL